MEIELNSAKRDPFALDSLAWALRRHVRANQQYFLFLFIAFSTYLAQFGKKIKMLIKGDKQACLPRC